MLEWFEEQGNQARFISRRAVNPTSPIGWDKLNASYTIDNRIATYSSFDFPDDSETHSPSDFGDRDVRIISKVEEDRLFIWGCERGWKFFYKQYPDAKSLLNLSKVGFRSNNKEAIVYFVYYRGCLDAGGALVMLGKKQGRWSVVKVIPLWIS